MDEVQGDDRPVAPDGFVQEVEPAVLAGVAVRSSRPTDEAVVAVLRDAVERVVDQCMGVELSWRTAAVVRSAPDHAWSWDDARDGIDWDLVLGQGEPLARVAVSAAVSTMVDQWWHPKWRPVTVVATFQDDGAAQADPPEPDTVVRFSMHRWAMYGGGEDLVRVAGFVEPWLLDAADRLRADTGFAALDRYTADPDASPWERATGVACWERDVTATLWGYGWGTLLSPVHVAAMGGGAALRALLEVVPAARVRDVGAGRTWVTLGDDPGAVTAEEVAALRQALLPALPRGTRTFEDFERAVARGEVTERLVL